MQQVLLSLLRRVTRTTSQQIFGVNGILNAILLLDGTLVTTIKLVATQVLLPLRRAHFQVLNDLLGAQRLLLVGSVLEAIVNLTQHGFHVRGLIR